MPIPGYKSVTVPEETYLLAKKLAKLGIEDSIGDAFTNAIKEYAEKRQEQIKELEAIRAKWRKEPSWSR